MTPKITPQQQPQLNNRGLFASSVDVWASINLTLKDFFPVKGEVASLKRKT
jgi:hypothetical protein